MVLLEQLGRLRVSYGELREQRALRPGFPVAAPTPEDIDERAASARYRTRSIVSSQERRFALGCG